MDTGKSNKSKVAHQKSDLSDRVKDIKERFENIKDDYIQSDRATLTVTQQKPS